MRHRDDEPAFRIFLARCIGAAQCQDHHCGVTFLRPKEFWNPVVTIKSIGRLSRHLHGTVAAVWAGMGGLQRPTWATRLDLVRVVGLAVGRERSVEGLDSHTVRRSSATIATETWERCRAIESAQQACENSRGHVAAVRVSDDSLKARGLKPRARPDFTVV